MREAKGRLRNRKVPRRRNGHSKKNFQKVSKRLRKV